LLLDEPTNGLDIPSKRQFRRAVAASISENQSILISTHQVRDMENLIDPIIVLDSGQIVFFHELAEVSEKLAVTVDTEPPTGDDVVYVEKGIGGYTVMRQSEKAGSSIDLELLFNAVVDPNSRVSSVLSQSSSGGVTHE
jgi:ABC-2 type transport system ATP-binding protein